ncbi:MAG TPA: phage head closure protein [Ruminiclostridium sp.]
MVLSNRLNNKIDVYSKNEYTNELLEKDYRYEKSSSIWAEISPLNGTENKSQGNTKFADISHKFVIRDKALTVLTNDMYFIFKNQRYDIKYFNPNYKYRDSIEIFCSLVVE